MAFYSRAAAVNESLKFANLLSLILALGLPTSAFDLRKTIMASQFLRKAQARWVPGRVNVLPPAPGLLPNAPRLPGPQLKMFLAPPRLGVPSMAGLRMRREEFNELAQLFTGLELDSRLDSRNARSPNVPHLAGGIHALELTPNFWQTNRPSSDDDGSLRGNPGTSNRQEYFNDVAEGAQGGNTITTPTSTSTISAALDQSVDDPDSRPPSSASTASLLSVGELLRELGSRSIRPLNTFVDELKAKVWSRLRRRRR